MARVMPASASERSGWRPAKATRSASVTGMTGWCGAWIVPARRSIALPQVGQAGHQPPGLGRLVVTPALAVPDAADGLGIAVDHPDLDVAHHHAIGFDGPAHVAVRGDLHLLV